MANIDEQILHQDNLKEVSATWQTWREAPIFLIGRIGVDKRLARETTFDNPRFLLFSGSGAKGMSNEHTLTASLFLLLRFLYNNAVNYHQISK
jgi:hypothetical protein